MMKHSLQISSQEHHNKDSGLYIGMMSGTSLDGMDAVLCQFSKDGHRTHVTQIASISVNFETALHQTLLALCTPNSTDTLFPKMSELEWFGLASRQYGEFAAEVVQALLNKAHVHANEVVAIGCHGQTVRHRPHLGFSLQLLDANILSEYTQICVVSDFRRRDMAVGGQGAPLVPAFHEAIFGKTDKAQIVLNLGGIANITVLPSIHDEQSILGYDTGPANILMDAWISRHKGQSYDQNGEWANGGTINAALLSTLLDDNYFKMTPPKSTGREAFNLVWLDNLLAHQNNAINAQDVQATLCELTAISASQEIRKFAQNNTPVYVCGGGAYNTYLLSRLANHLPRCTIQTTAALGLSPTWVESTAFAWLARQTLLRKSGNVPAVTGAGKSVILGQICIA